MPKHPEVMIRRGSSAGRGWLALLSLLLVLAVVQIGCQFMPAEQPEPGPAQSMSNSTPTVPDPPVQTPAGKPPATTTLLPPDPTVTPTVHDPPSLETLLPTGTARQPAGQISFLYRYADAGNFVLQAGATITLTWEEAPLDADRYEFTLIPHHQDTPLVLGSDMDVSDGISIEWAVPERVSATMRGVAYFADGQVAYSAWAREVYSGESPPEGICSISSASIGPLDLFREPISSSDRSDRIAYLTPGVYAQVFGQTSTGWYRVDAQVAIDPVDGETAAGTGWVFGQAGVVLHGLCDDIPTVKP